MLEFVKMNENLWVANDNYQRMFHVQEQEDGKATLKIYGNGRMSNVTLSSVSEAFNKANEIYGSTAQ